MVAHLLISGSVQGVGYRQFVKSHAMKLGLTGWVKNTIEGSVEAIVEGEKDSIEQMITLCKKGPFLAEVQEVHVEWTGDDKPQFPSFTITHD